MTLFFFLLHFVTISLDVLQKRFSRDVAQRYGQRKSLTITTALPYRFPRKPEWVVKEVLRMKALMPIQGCRKLADTFNRRFAHKDVSVGKTFVNDTIRKHRYEIQVLRKRLKHRKPKPMPLNRVWGMDLTGKQDTAGDTHYILGLVEHGSRANLSLVGLRNKASITLLRHLFDAVETYGKPTFIRTDNEAAFTSRLFRFGLWLLGIKHQRSDKGCPWMNGRIERFFGTLKEKLSQWEVDSLEQLNNTLVPFRFWYNHIRPHQHLDGRTPDDIWTGDDVFVTKPKRATWFEAWDGLLTGYYLRP